MMNVKVTGTRALMKAMNDFPKEVKRRKEVLDPGLIAGAVVVRDAARAIAPHDTGVLSRNIIVQRWSRPEERMEATVVVRVRKLKGSQIARLVARNKKKGAARYKGDPFYWRFVEFGTSKMRSQPFLRPAFEVQKERAVAAAIKVFRIKVEDIVTKLGKRSGLDKVELYFNRMGGRR